MRPAKLDRIFDYHTFMVLSLHLIDDILAKPILSDYEQTWVELVLVYFGEGEKLS